MDEKKHYRPAFAPEYLTKLTIEKLPVQEVHYIEPGDEDDYREEPAIFVTHDRRIRMSTDYKIDPDDTDPASPIGMVGVMRVEIIDPVTGNFRSAYIADLRFIGQHDLIDYGKIVDIAVDQEEAMAMLNALEDTIHFDAFIATDEDFEAMDETIPEGEVYGDPNLEAFIDILRQRGDAVHHAFVRRQKKAKKAAKKAAAAKAIETATIPAATTEEPAKKPEQESSKVE